MINATAFGSASFGGRALLPAVAGPAPIGPLGLEVGTGGAATFVYVQSRGNMGYPFVGYEWSGRVASAGAGPTIIENISRIRAILNPTVTDLAGILQVSRQAIYDWQAGKPIAEENAARLAELVKAADLFAVEGLRGTSQAMRRPIKDGKNFFELIKDGSPADTAARGLIEIVRSEFRQREALRKRLAGRKRPSRDVFGDIGAPMLNEKE
jgi:transcriptional regulator with XRE-family HTH domain